MPAPAPVAGPGARAQPLLGRVAGHREDGDGLRAQVAARQGAQPARPREAGGAQAAPGGPAADLSRRAEPARCAAAARLLVRRASSRPSAPGVVGLRARRPRGLRGRGLREPRRDRVGAREPGACACRTACALEQPPSRRSARSRCRACASPSPTLGEIAAVIGLGLIGQLAVQLLRANGCRVLGIDLDPARVKQALDAGRRVGRPRPDDDHARLARSRDRRPRRRLRAGHGRLARARRRSSSPPSCAASRAGSSSVGATAMELDRRALLREGARAAHEHVVRPGSLRPRATRSSGSTTRSPTCAGPRTATCRPSSALVAARRGRPRGARRADRPLRRGRDAPTRSWRAASGARSPRASATTRTPSRAREHRAARAPAPASASERRRGLPRRRQLREGRSCCRRSRHAPEAPARAARDRDAGPRPGAARGEVRLRALRHRSGRGVREPRGRSRLRSRRGTTATPRSPPRRCARARRSGSRSPPALDRERGRGALRERVARDRRLPGDRLQPALLAARARGRARPSRSAPGPLAIHYTRRRRRRRPRGTWITRPARRRRSHHRRGLPLRRPLQRTSSARRRTSVFARVSGRDPETRRLDGGDARLRRRLDGDASSTWPTPAPELPKERFEVSADGRTARCDNFRPRTRAAGRRRAAHAEPGQGAGGRARARCSTRARRETLSVPLAEIAGVSHACFALLASLESGSPEGVAS